MEREPSLSTTARRLAAALVFGCLPTLNACGIIGAQEQIERMDAACVIDGTVHGEVDGPETYAVVLFDESAMGLSLPPRAMDQVLSVAGGEWFFAVEPGRYSLVAFRDTDGDGTPGDSDPVHRVLGARALECPAGGRFGGMDIVVPADAPLARDLPAGARAGLHPTERSTSAVASVGQFSRLGKVTELADPRFEPAIARRGMWRPVDFVSEGKAGVYLLEPYDPDRVPVLFVHGIGGSPRDFRELAAHIDRDRFQPMFYYYPSGVGLGENAAFLAQTMTQLEIRHGIDEVHLVAHSMGGLIGHAFLRERERRGSPAQIAHFLTLATPWGGHAAAEWGVKMSPVVLPVWRDMAPASRFISELFNDSHPVAASGLPDHHLLFAYRNDAGRSRVATDGVVTLESMLRPEAQAQADSVMGIHDTHVGILDNPRTITRVNAILATEGSR